MKAVVMSWRVAAIWRMKPQCRCRWPALLNQSFGEVDELPE
jgi:hypothetical protein